VGYSRFNGAMPTGINKDFSYSQVSVTDAVGFGDSLRTRVRLSPAKIPSVLHRSASHFGGSNAEAKDPGGIRWPTVRSHVGSHRIPVDRPAKVRPMGYTIFDCIPM
jgi:hypothetical protein